MRAARMWGILVFTAWASEGCGLEPRRPAFASPEEWPRLVQAPAQQQDGGRRVWHVALAPMRATYLVEMSRLLPLGRHPRADLTLVILSGKARVRVDPERERLVGAGERLFVPRRAAYRLRRVGPAPLLYTATFVPDEPERLVFEAVP